MFEKDRSFELYTREKFTLEEKLYKDYVSMRKTMNDLENCKYAVDDKMLESTDFKQGFLAGVKIMSSLLLDI